MKQSFSLISAGFSLVTLVIACNSGFADSADVAAAGSPSFDAAAAYAADAGVANSRRNVVGSELCNIDLQGTCQPDDLTACEEATGLAGDSGGDGGPVTLADAGVTDAAFANDAGPQPPADAGAGLLACRVVRRGTTVGPQCTASGAGKDGDACRASLDCGVGFECVGNPGQCRRYCCLGSKSCGEGRVCDKQTLFGDESVTVPVCAPVHPCQLLAPKACPDNQTCAIADQRNGQTSCLTIGSAQVGESCETINCGAGLTCLGQEGTRSCFKLCTKSKYGDCPSETKCKGSAPLFTNLDQGVCIKDISSH